MKKFTLILVLLSNCLWGQEWNHLGNDPSGDCRFPTQMVDIVDVAYKKVGLDSFYLRLVADTNGVLFTPGYGLVFALDTNGMPTDGNMLWGGDNEDLIPDTLIGYFTNFGVPLENAVISSSNDTLILKVNKNSWVAEGALNFVIGTGFWGAANVNTNSIGDTAPDSGYYSLDLLSSVPNILNDEFVSIYPNPVGDVLHLNSYYNKCHVQILNTLGKLVYSKDNIESGELNINHLAPDTYFLLISRNGSNIAAHKIVKL